MSSNLDRSLRIPPKDQNRDSKLHLELIWDDISPRTQERTKSLDGKGKQSLHAFLCPVRTPQTS
jgi:hypothetical protein